MVICTAAKEALKPVRESGKSVRNLEIKNEKYPSCSPKKHIYTHIIVEVCLCMIIIYICGGHSSHVTDDQ